MIKVSLKSIIGKNKGSRPMVESLMQKLGGNLWVEDESGTLLLGEPGSQHATAWPINLGEYLAGWVKGDTDGDVLANVLQQLLEKELDKKKLGNEVLGLYHEINVIYNFSEKISRTIDPDRIAITTLEQAGQSIPFDGGIMVLWDEAENKLKIPAQMGEALFGHETLVTDGHFLLSLGLSKQSEILEDLQPLKSRGMVAENVASLMYASIRMKHRIMGAIILVRKNGDQFTAAQLKLLVTLSLQSAAAIESALLYERNIREAREREEAIMRIHEVTKKFVPYEFIHSLGKETLSDVRLGDQVEKIVTVLFTDIRDFTTLS
ncbi:MAG TPA: GAF domain-containing protein, partial [Phnomibacter sp.]|nr:GAF domain-containing protein [Phnomibacter sp.]